MADIERYGINLEGNGLTKSRGSAAKVGNEIPINMGGNEPKHFADVTITQEGIDGSIKERHAGRFVRKQFYDKGDALNYLHIVESLRVAGVEVPPTVRYQEDGGKHYLVITDLTENGNTALWSANNSDEDLLSVIKTPEEAAKVVLKMKEYAEKASKLNIQLSADAYFVTRDKSGELKVLVGDIGMGLWRLDVKQWSNAEALENNYRSITNYLFALKSTRSEEVADLFSSCY